MPALGGARARACLRGRRGRRCGTSATQAFRAFLQDRLSAFQCMIGERIKCQDQLRYEVCSSVCKVFSKIVEAPGQGLKILSSHRVHTCGDCTSRRPLDRPSPARGKSFDGLSAAFAREEKASLRDARFGHVYGKRDSIHHHLLEGIFGDETLPELRQKPLHTTPLGWWWWCINSVFRVYDYRARYNAIQPKRSAPASKGGARSCTAHQNSVLHASIMCWSHVVRRPCIVS